MRSSPHESDPTDRREAILEAALELFAERGFHGTAVPLVAERARVGAGTIYRYFASKEQLVNVLYKRWKTAIAHAIVTDFPTEAPAREQFHVLWRRAVAFAVEHPMAFKFLELHHHSPYLDEQSRAAEAGITATALALLMRTEEQQVTKAVDAGLLMAIVWGSLVGTIKAAWEGRLKLTEETLAAAEQCVWEAIRR